MSAAEWEVPNASMQAIFMTESSLSFSTCCDAWVIKASRACDCHSSILFRAFRSRNSKAAIEIIQ